MRHHMYLESCGILSHPPQAAASSFQALNASYIVEALLIYLLAPDSMAYCSCSKDLATINTRVKRISEPSR